MEKTNRIPVWLIVLLAIGGFVILGLLMILTLAFMNGLKRMKDFTLKESVAHFAVLEQRLKETAESFDLELVKTSTLYNNDPSCREVVIRYSIEVDESSDIELGLSNTPMNMLGSTEKGEEEYFISYYRRTPSAEFNTELFTALVNSVSGQEVTDEVCKAFLNTNDGSYGEIDSKPDSIWITKFYNILPSSSEYQMHNEWVKEGSERDAVKDAGYLEYWGMNGPAASVSKADN